MEELYASVVPSIIDGYMWGFKIIFDSLIQHPLLSAFLIALIVLNRLTRKHYH